MLRFRLNFVNTKRKKERWSFPRVLHFIFKNIEGRRLLEEKNYEASYLRECCLMFFLFLYIVTGGILKREGRNKNRKFYHAFNTVHQFNVCHRIMMEKRVLEESEKHQIKLPSWNKN